MNRCLCYLIPFLTIGIAYTQDIDWKKLPADPVNSIRIAPYRELAPLENGEKEISFPNLYLQFNTSGLYSLLTDWKNQNILSDGTYPSTQSIIFGGEAGCVINKYLQIGIGYEYFFTTKVTTLYATGDQITSTFFTDH